MILWLHPVQYRWMMLVWSRSTGVFCVCGATAWRCSNCLQSSLCRFQWSAAALSQESLEAVAKENKELQAQISQLAADLDGRILHRLDGNCSWAPGRRQSWALWGITNLFTFLLLQEMELKVKQWLKKSKNLHLWSQRSLKAMKKWWVLMGREAFGFSSKQTFREGGRLNCREVPLGGWHRLFISCEAQ